MMLLIFILLASAAFGFETPIINEKSQMSVLEDQNLSIMNCRTGHAYTRSDVFNQQDTTGIIDRGVARIHVTLSEDDVFNALVYVFSESGIYLGQNQRTNESGTAMFGLPAKSYKFRVDYGGTRHWSDVIPIIAHEKNDIALDLGLLALNLTNDPNPVRYDGKLPEYESERVLLASIGVFPGILAQSMVAQIPPRKVYYYINDHLGTPIKMMDENGDVVWSADYRPFGEAAITVDDVENNFRFPGQYHDQETGLHYNYFRYYSPETGRYLRPDPIGLAGGINLFAYAQDNPVNFVDPDGKLALTGLVALGFLASKAMAVGVSWAWLQTATYFIKNPLLPSDNPCEDYRLSNVVNDVMGGIAVFNIGLGVNIGILELGAALYPELMVAAGTPQGQRILSNAADFILSAVPSTAPIPNLPGLAGHLAGEAYSSLKN